MAYERSQLRITTWPGTVPEVQVVWLPVELGGEVTDEFGSRTRLVVHDSDAEPSYVELPQELVIRGLLELDTDDDGAVVGFLRKFGFIEPPFKFPRPGDYYPLLDVSPTLAEVSAYLRIARALALHWIAHKDGGDIVAPWRTVADLWAGYLWSEEVYEAPDNEDDAWFAFVPLLNGGLAAYQARAEYIGDEDAPVGGPEPDLFSGLCLQLLNIITEDLPVLRCANKTCERVFIRQEGRAEQGQYRTGGVMYCSKQCARAQATRNYRQRQRRAQQ